MKVKKCAFTGHRPQSLPFGFNESDERCIALKQTLRAEIIRLIEQKGVTHFISGMALGVDMYAAEIVLGLKSSYEGITLESAIPCESQAEKWTEKQRDRYFEIASKCDKETLIQHHYTSDCMHCQRRMVKNLKRRPENDPNAGNIALVIYAGTLSAGQLSAGSSAGGTGWTPAFHRSLSR